MQLQKLEAGSMGRRRLQQSSDGWFSYTSTKAAVPRSRNPRPFPQPKPRRNPRVCPLRRLFPTPQPSFTPDPLSPINTSPSPVDTSFPTPQPSFPTPFPHPHPTPHLPSSSTPMETSPTDDPAIHWYSSHPKTKQAYATDPYLIGRLRFDYPPHPSKPGWKDRCYKCLVCGHDAADCPAPVRACARCLRPSHGYSSCPRPGRSNTKAATSVLNPRGSITDASLPQDRPSIVDVYLPQSANDIDDLRYLTKGVVVDARLRPGSFCPAKIQAAILTFASAAEPYPMVHMAGERFLFLLEEAANREAFIDSVKPKLETLGLAIYPWSPAIDAELISYRFKLWIDLCNMPINSWKLQHVLSVVGQFGLFLEHVPFTNVSSVEKLRVLVAVRSLSDVPRTARLVVRGIRKRVTISVIAGVDEALEITPPRDTTPSASYFADLKAKLRQNPPPSHGFNRQQPKVTSVTLDFETAFRAWAALPPSTEKEELGRKLQDSPYWSIARNQERLGRLPPPPPPLPLSPPPLSDPISFRHTVCDTLIHAKSQEGAVAVEDPTCNARKTHVSAPLCVRSPQPTPTPPLVASSASDPLVASSSPKQMERAPQSLGVVLPPHVSLSSKHPSAQSTRVPIPTPAPQTVGCSSKPLSSSGLNFPLNQLNPFPLPTQPDSLPLKPTISAQFDSPSPSPNPLLPKPSNLAPQAFSPSEQAEIRTGQNPLCPALSPPPSSSRKASPPSSSLKPDYPAGQALLPKPYNLAPSSAPPVQAEKLMSGPSPSSGQAEIRAGTDPLSPSSPGQALNPKPPGFSLLRRTPSPPRLDNPFPLPTVPAAPATSPADSPDIRRSSRLGKPNKKLQGFHVGTKRKTTKEGGNISKKAIQTALQEAGVTRTLNSVREADAFLSSDERMALRGYCTLLPSTDTTEPPPVHCPTSANPNEDASVQTGST